MNKLLIYKYINNIKKEDIKQFGSSQNINLSDNELDVIYDYIKYKTNKLFDNPQEAFMEIKDKVNINVYDKIIELYDKYKDYIK